MKTEVIIGSDEDEPELSETKELSLANRFSAFKGKTFDFSLKLVNPDKMRQFQTVQMRKAGVISSVTSLIKAFISQKVSVAQHFSKHQIGREKFPTLKLVMNNKINSIFNSSTLIFRPASARSFEA